MSYAVLVQELRTAASGYRAVAGDLGAAVEITSVGPDSIGHVELAAWVEAVADQCAKATTALHDGATGLGESLDVAANHYETTDEQVGEAFRSPLAGGGPLGAGSPFYPPLAGPWPGTVPGPTPGGGR